MRVGMSYRVVPMPMGVRFRHWPGVFVLMMIVMDVAMLVLDCIVHMDVLVAFGEVKPQANSHEHGSQHYRHRHRLAEKQ
jgi:hypothetical protein